MFRGGFLEEAWGSPRMVRLHCGVAQAVDVGSMTGQVCGWEHAHLLPQGAAPGWPGDWTLPVVMEGGCPPGGTMGFVRCARGGKGTELSKGSCGCRPQGSWPGDHQGQCRVSRRGSGCSTEGRPGGPQEGPWRKTGQGAGGRTAVRGLLKSRTEKLWRGGGDSLGGTCHPWEVPAPLRKPGRPGSLAQAARPPSTAVLGADRTVPARMQSPRSCPHTTSDQRP